MSWIFRANTKKVDQINWVLQHASNMKTITCWTLKKLISSYKLDYQYSTTTVVLKIQNESKRGTWHHGGTGWFNKKHLLHFLVGGFDPSKTILVKWDIFPNRGEHKNNLKPPLPPSFETGVVVQFEDLSFPWKLLGVCVGNLGLPTALFMLPTSHASGHWWGNLLSKGRSFLSHSPFFAGFSSHGLEAASVFISFYWGPMFFRLPHESHEPDTSISFAKVVNLKAHEVGCRWLPFCRSKGQTITIFGTTRLDLPNPIIDGFLRAQLGTKSQIILSKRDICPGKKESPQHASKCHTGQ